MLQNCAHPNLAGQNSYKKSLCMGSQTGGAHPSGSFSAIFEQFFFYADALGLRAQLASTFDTPKWSTMNWLDQPQKKIVETTF